VTLGRPSSRCGLEVEAPVPCRDAARWRRCRRRQQRRRRSGARRRGRASFPGWSPASSRGPSPASSPSVCWGFECLLFAVLPRAFVLTRVCGVASWRPNRGVHRRVGGEGLRQRRAPGSRTGGFCGGRALHRGPRGVPRVLERRPIHPAEHILHGL
jgi:hypothetical protein